MVAFLRTRVSDALKNVIEACRVSGPDSTRSTSSKKSVAGNFDKNLQSEGHDIDRRVSPHLEPSLDPVSASPVKQHLHTNPFPQHQSQAMANRDGRRAPVLHAGESAQRRLF